MRHFHRFLFLFFAIYIIVELNGVIPYTETIYNWYIKSMFHIIPWFGSHILHLAKPITVFTNGSGDTTFDYVTLLFIFIMAALGTGIWAGISRRPKSTTTLQYWTIVLIRYYLAATMFLYGMIKVIKLQFPSPTLTRLLEPYGHSSPMGLAWTYMGFSQGFNYFAGGAEVLSGLLLLFRRTTAAGALLTVIVGSHIMAVNYCYDVPVKLLSTMIVVMALAINFLSGNIHRITAFFFGDKTAHLEIIPPPAIHKAGHYLTLRIIKLLFAAYILIGITIDVLKSQKQYGDAAPKTALYGIYSTRTFARNTDTLAPLQTDTIRWKRLIIEGTPDNAFATLHMMDDSTKKFYRVTTDTIHHTLLLTSYTDTTKIIHLTYDKPRPDSLVLKGDSLFITAKRTDKKDFLLMNRGFRFINERPFNK